MSSVHAVVLGSARHGAQEVSRSQAGPGGRSPHQWPLDGMEEVIITEGRGSDSQIHHHHNGDSELRFQMSIKRNIPEQKVSLRLLWS